GENAYAQPNLARVDINARRQFKVLIIGAGMSGLLSAIRLQEAGIPFQIVEKNADVGGTWYENTYPGCRVDSGNHVYSYSFRQKDWPQYFSSQPVLREYFADTADAYDLRRHVRFNTEVESARFDEASGLWRLHVRTADGGTETLEGNVLISCVGQLNQPKMPDLPGVGSFQGPAFHSARWDHAVDLKGKRVGVIGTGGSAFQFVPHVAESAASVTVFQRTAPWVLLNEQYFSHIPEGVHWLLNNLPYYDKWYRFSLFWKSAEGMLAAVTVDPGWNQPEQSVSQANEDFRVQLLDAMREHLKDRPDLVDICTPDYPPGAKRMLVDDGRWFNTLKRDNVKLTTNEIDAITASGILCKDGETHDFDVLIYGTGFKASDFLTPIRIYGRGGVELHDAWAGEPRAFQGITFPGFPNLFCTYGPNTNIVVNSSIIFFSECEVRYILGCLAELIRRSPSATMDVKQEVHDAYNERIDAGNRMMAWGQSSVNTWYKNASGRITQNWPFTLIEFWRQSKQPDPSHYEFSG
ncbi:MAG: NAD(P)/FAD-dependent oxidoreductase, partial [Pseudomonadales bacterium]|nr:NAD(P)/FAD-dependent oxidoreductase [Pseudomonadales bacterium]